MLINLNISRKYSNAFLNASCRRKIYFYTFFISIFLLHIIFYLKSEYNKITNVRIIKHWCEFADLLFTFIFSKIWSLCKNPLKFLLSKLIFWKTAMMVTGLRGNSKFSHEMYTNSKKSFETNKVQFSFFNLYIQ